jgi:benzodiazapine receptor
MSSFDPIFWYYFLTVVAVAVIGFFVSRNSFGPNGFYNVINKPSITPPRLVFPIVWAILYILMIVAGYYADTASIDDTETQECIRYLFMFQLLLNLGWTIAFFGMGNIILALVCNLLLLFVLIYLLVIVYPISQTSFWLFFPYALWTTFALFLTLSIYSKNINNINVNNMLI